MSKTIELTPISITREILEELEEMGLLITFKPNRPTMKPPPGENLGETIYVSDSKFGPHKLIAVGVNKTQVRLGVHGDSEEFLIPQQEEGVKPVYLVICHLPEDEICSREVEGNLNSSDFTCLSMYPAPRGAEMFTMLKGTVHCEATTPGVGNIGCFYVTESKDLDLEWIDLEYTELIIEQYESQ